MAALLRVAWTTQAPDAMRTREGMVLYFGEGQGGEEMNRADPRSMKRWLRNGYECEALRHSDVSKDITCLGGGRGYGREKEGRRSEQGPTP